MAGRRRRILTAQSLGLRRIEESSRIWDEPERHRLARSLSQRANDALFDLRAMVEAGLLLARGRNRGAYYEAAAPPRVDDALRLTL